MICRDRCSYAARAISRSTIALSATAGQPASAELCRDRALVHLPVARKGGLFLMQRERFAGYGRVLQRATHETR